MILLLLSADLPCRYPHHWPSITAILFSKVAKPESRQPQKRGGGQVREIGMHQDEEAEEESCHPALQGRNDYTENNGNNRH